MARYIRSTEAGAEHGASTGRKIRIINRPQNYRAMRHFCGGSTGDTQSLCGGFPSAEIGVPSTDPLRLVFQESRTSWDSRNSQQEHMVVAIQQSREFIEQGHDRSVSCLSRIRLRHTLQPRFEFESHGTRPSPPPLITRLARLSP